MFGEGGKIMPDKSEEQSESKEAAQSRREAYGEAVRAIPRDSWETMPPMVFGAATPPVKPLDEDP